MRQPTTSVRYATMANELWLNAKGQWASFKERKRFNGANAADKAEQFVQTHFGVSFQTYGLFTNS